MTLPTSTFREVEDLLFACNWALDDCDPDAWADCFAPDGEFIRHSPGPGADPPRLTGRQELIGFVEEVRRDLGAGRLRHSVSNLVVSQAPEGLQAKSYITVIDAAPAAASRIFALGRYEDQLVRRDGAWRLARRVVRID
jgi:3-phenylpropionate/cinnamic acid dioxygenase small subunit